MKILNILLEITIYSVVLFCAIMLLKRFFKNKMSPFLHFAIWGLLIARLLIPVTLDPGNYEDQNRQQYEYFDDIIDKEMDTSAKPAV